MLLFAAVLLLPLVVLAAPAPLNLNSNNVVTNSATTSNNQQQQQTQPSLSQESFRDEIWPHNTLILNGKVVFVGKTQRYGGEPWVTTDETSNTIRLLEDLAPGGWGLNSNPFLPLGDYVHVAAKSFFYFRGWNGTKSQIFVTDATPEGTNHFFDLTSLGMVGKSHNKGYGLFVGGTKRTGPEPIDLYYFAIDEDNTGQVVESTLLESIPPPAENSTVTGQRMGRPLILNESHVLFHINLDLWISEGTTEGTNFVTRVTPTTTNDPPVIPGWIEGTSSFYTYPNAGNNSVALFRAVTFAAPELWRTDGTPEGTVPITTMDENSDNYHRVNVSQFSEQSQLLHDKYLLFYGSTNTSQQEGASLGVLATDGWNVQVLATTKAPAFSIAHFGPIVNDTMLFVMPYDDDNTATDAAVMETTPKSLLFVTNGEPHGTHALNVGNLSNTTKKVAYIGSTPLPNGRVVMVVESFQNWQLTYEIWTSNYTAQGTRWICDIEPQVVYFATGDYSLEFQPRLVKILSDNRIFVTYKTFVGSGEWKFALISMESILLLDEGSVVVDNPASVPTTAAPSPLPSLQATETPSLVEPYTIFSQSPTATKTTLTPSLQATETPSLVEPSTIFSQSPTATKTTFTTRPTVSPPSTMPTTTNDGSAAKSPSSPSPSPTKTVIVASGNDDQIDSSEEVPSSSADGCTTIMPSLLLLLVVNTALLTM